MRFINQVDRLWSLPSYGLKNRMLSMILAENSFFTAFNHFISIYIHYILIKNSVL